jgi:hypothetical protein
MALGAWNGSVRRAGALNRARDRARKETVGVGVDFADRS